MVQTTNDNLPRWKVHAEAVGDEPYDDGLLERLLDNLPEHDGVVTGTPEEPIDGRARYGAGFSVQASTPWRRSPGRARCSSAPPRPRDCRPGRWLGSRRATKERSILSEDGGRYCSEASEQ